MRFLAGDFWCDGCDPSESHLSSCFFLLTCACWLNSSLHKKTMEKRHDVISVERPTSGCLCFEHSPGMVHGHWVRSCFLSSLLFWWWSFWSCLPQDFLCDRNTWRVWNIDVLPQFEGNGWDHGMMMAFLTVPFWNLACSEPQNPPFFGRESGSTPDKSFGLVPSFQRVAVNCLLHLHDYTTWMFIYIYIYILHIFKYSRKIYIYLSIQRL